MLLLCLFIWLAVTIETIMCLLFINNIQGLKQVYYIYILRIFLTKRVFSCHLILNCSDWRSHFYTHLKPHIVRFHGQTSFFLGNMTLCERIRTFTQSHIFCMSSHQCEKYQIWTSVTQKGVEVTDVNLFLDMSSVTQLMNHSNESFESF